INRKRILLRNLPLQSPILPGTTAYQFPIDRSTCCLTSELRQAYSSGRKLKTCSSTVWDDLQICPEPDSCGTARYSAAKRQVRGMSRRQHDGEGSRQHSQYSYLPPRRICDARCSVAALHGEQGPRSDSLRLTNA